jgi:hypothetical protein
MEHRGSIRGVRSTAAAFVLAGTMALVMTPRPADAAMELATDPNPVVVELYTSQGCSSCPPADKFLGELAQRRDVLALAFHVDYWNYIGWQDPFSSPAATERQRTYGNFLELRAIYTPQMVIDGTVHEVGSDRGAVASAIKNAARAQKIPVTLLNDENGFRVHIGAGDPGTRARVWLVEYDPEATTDVKRGENAGKELVEYNIVQAWRVIGTWDGSATEIVLPQAETDAGACAVIVQEDPIGAIYGAAAFRMEME